MSGSEVRWAGHPDDVVLEFRGQRDKTGQRSAQKKGAGLCALYRNTNKI